MLEGTQIGGYRIVRQIGEGGMGAIFMAEHAMLGRRAAIKVLHREYSMRQDIITRFFNEARAATAIADPGIIQVFDFGYHTDSSAFIVMELLDGEPLDTRLRRQGALPIMDALRICRQTAAAVGAAHARGIVHRDLKPENIFLVRDNEVAGGERAKVLDFGIAKLAGDLGGGQKTSTQAIIGTPEYMSPEQCRGAGLVDQRSDVYSLGCVLYALVTGHAPFNVEGTGAMIMAHMVEPPTRPSARLMGVPREVDDLILRCLAKNPDERFSSGTELAAAIEAVMGRSSIVGMTHGGATAVAPHGVAMASGTSPAITGNHRPASKRRNALLAGLGVVVVLGAIIVAVVAQGDSKSEAAVDPTEQSTQAIALEPAKPQSAPPATEPPKPAATTTAPPTPQPVPALDAVAETAMKAQLAAFAAWTESHAGAPCPTSQELGGGLDPWGKAYIVTCLDQPADQRIGIVSSGPDGAPNTGDDIASWTLGRTVTDIVRGTRWVPVSMATAQPTAKKPKPKAAGTKTKPTSASGVFDLDGDGIPDVR
ncbi:MAG: protein kinase [Kofleriaceae bacterium]|nr:protein kinase [Kofleriaceae bacterium]